MDIDSLIIPIFQAFNTGIGSIFVNLLKVVYSLIWPANSPAATA
ncbi:MAG: hypothetical protein Q3972_04090 [Corynebacterium sp.]|nr:hypothetical protein [Corynebacterium sp.]